MSLLLVQICMEIWGLGFFFLARQAFLIVVEGITEITKPVSKVKTPLPNPK